MRENFYSRCLNLIKHFQAHRESLIIKGNAVHSEFEFRFNEFISPESIAILERVSRCYLHSESYHEFVKMISKELSAGECVLIATRVLPLCVECGLRFYNWNQDSRIAMVEACELLTTASIDANSVRDGRRANFTAQTFKKILAECKSTDKSLKEICERLNPENPKSFEVSFRIWFKNEFGYTFSLKKLRGI